MTLPVLAAVRWIAGREGVEVEIVDVFAVSCVAHLVCDDFLPILYRARTEAPKKGDRLQVSKEGPHATRYVLAPYKPAGASS